MRTSFSTSDRKRSSSNAAALCKFHVIEGQKRARLDCVLCILFIVSGSPNERWLHTCQACVIVTWRLQASPVARNNAFQVYAINS